MRRITGRRIEEKYASITKKNSFYREEMSDKYSMNSFSISNGEPTILYYIDNKTNELKMKHTLLLG